MAGIWCCMAIKESHIGKLNFALLVYGKPPFVAVSCFYVRRFFLFPVKICRLIGVLLRNLTTFVIRIGSMPFRDTCDKKKKRYARLVSWKRRKFRTLFITL